MRQPYRRRAMTLAREKLVTIPDSAWCNGYNDRNKNPLLRIVTIAAAAEVVIVPITLPRHSGSLRAS
jgi:hypothetical protein